MVSLENTKKAISEVIWEEGKTVRLGIISYRNALVITCSSCGRQKAFFKNGEFPYFVFLEFVSKDGVWTKQGMNVVPVLADGRILMVVEQRPPVARYGDGPTHVEFESGNTLLSKFGPYSTLEFPGGGIEPNETFTAGFLSELQEESGVKEQIAMLYRCLRPVYNFSSDVSARNFSGVIFLSGFSFESHVETDGGLNVLALTEKEVNRNIINGVISSGQAALVSWLLYKDVVRAREDAFFKNELLESGYLSIEEVKIKKTN